MHCQRCVSPVQAGDSWWLSPGLASRLGWVAHVLIWFDTVIWLLWIILERIPQVKAIIKVAENRTEGVNQNVKDQSSVNLLNRTDESLV